MTEISRVVHKPSSLWTAKEECQALGGSLLSLANSGEVVNVLDKTMIGNVRSDYRIDGWKEGKWLHGENETIAGDLTDSLMSPATLTMDLEDGAILSTRRVSSQVGFICESDGKRDDQAGCNGGSTVEESMIPSPKDLSSPEPTTKEEKKTCEET